MGDLGVVLITGVITAIVTWSIAQRRIAAQHITAERQEWREKMRTMAMYAYDAMLSGDVMKVARLRAEFSARLNPTDENDIYLLECLEVPKSSACRKAQAIKLSEVITLLMKHDWERAKLEASTFQWLWVKGVKRRSWTCWNKDKTKKLDFVYRYSKGWTCAILLSFAVLLGLACLVLWPGEDASGSVICEMLEAERLICRSLRYDTLQVV